MVSRVSVFLGLFLLLLCATGVSFTACSGAPVHDISDAPIGGTGGFGGGSSVASTADTTASTTGGGTKCTDGKKDGTETDVDCGGTCPGCPKGKACTKDTDCASMNCVTSMCGAPKGCVDGMKDGDETDIDCGGSCAACAKGKACAADGDCASMNCVNALCGDPKHCADGAKNSGETDIDCGGVCPPCEPGQGCSMNQDCIGMTCAVSVCGCPQGMLAIPVTGGGIYCMESTEVSYTQYQAFYAANPPTANQPAFCSWNLNYTPSGDWPAPAQKALEPVRYVNWCQADAYCRFVGRHLCGKIGGGAVTPPTDNVDFHKDQWFNACSAQGGNTYPYGSAYNASTCNGAVTLDGGASPGPAPPSSFMNCLGGEPGLLEMSGNVAEWEDACTGTAGNADLCLARGGSFTTVDPTALACDAGDPLRRDHASQDVGFRCCL